MKKIERKPISCGICGETFVPSSNCQKYCNDCKDRIKKEYAKRIENEDTTRRETCLCCGKVIDRKAYNSKLACSIRCAHILYAVTDKWRTVRRGVTKRKYVKTHEPTRMKRHPKKNNCLDADIAEARKLGLSYGMYMVQKREGVIE